MIGVVTTIIMVLRVAELFIDPFMGNIIDKTKTRWGRFKPWVIVGAFVAAITLAALFTDFGGLTVTNPTLYLILFAIVYFIMDVFYSAKDVAIWSMIPALSFDSHEREITATVARIGSVFGGQLVTIMVMPIVLYFSVNQNGGAGDPQGWFAFACIGGGIATLGAIILGIGTKEQESALRENKVDTSFKDVFLQPGRAEAGRRHGLARLPADGRDRLALPLRPQFPGAGRGSLSPLRRGACRLSLHAGGEPSRLRL